MIVKNEGIKELKIVLAGNVIAGIIVAPEVEGRDQVIIVVFRDMRSHCPPSFKNLSILKQDIKKD